VPVEKLTSIDPRTGAPAGSVPLTHPTEIGSIVKRSRKAFVDWSAITPRERRPYLKAYKRVVLSNTDRVAAVVQSETGKVPTDAYSGDVMPALNVMDYYTRTAHRLLRPRRGTMWPYAMVRSWTEYHPRGVAAVISPYNAPFFISMMGAFTAIAAGCSVVVKPSELTPMSGALVAELAVEAGLPADLVQVVQGDAAVGAALVTGGVDVVSFTGSPATGRRIMHEAADGLTPVILELGGKDAMVLLDDADAGEAARCAVWGSTFLAGQTCISVERVYVPESSYRDFMATAEREIDRLTVGTGDATDVGPLIDPQQLAIIEHQVADALAKGATVRRGGYRVEGLAGTYFAPTLIADVDHSMEVMQRETFGPILAVMQVRDEASALRLANDSAYGLHGSVWSRNKRRAARFAAMMETGTVAVNDHLINAFIPGIVFGGTKDSGFGTQLGPGGIHAFCYPKSMTSPKLIATSRLLFAGRWIPRRVGPRYWKALARALLRW
jgi:acyl-CoA reductase-like NAD-dependent aldehyde dehydrogenase